ncbi:response regulator [Mucilaginibacter phenanthrenivorans]|uniref:response regulator n=1 Tax=Mucilaginibacter phenanthrenivorans TaxID=1234842 RepID=UPI002157C896|nr:response regulator [Mucilaginibacter phenanthrenivorans]
MQNKAINVLLVDDDNLNNLISTKYIKKFFVNSNITSCLNGKIAIDLITETKARQPAFVYDYILLDLNMPVMNGWEFLDNYRYLATDANEKPRIFLLTSSVHDEDIKRASRYPFVKDYVVKPLFSDKICKIFNLIEAQ